MSEILAAAIGLISSVVVSIISIYGAKKLGIGPSQGQLVTTLKDLSSAQDMRIEQLEKDSGEKDTRIQFLEGRVKDLEGLVLSQAQTIARLEKGGN